MTTQANVRTQLEKFLRALEEFREVQIEEVGRETTYLEKLRRKLVRQSAKLRSLICPPDGKLLITQLGRVMDAFDVAFIRPVAPFGLPSWWHFAVSAVINKTNEAIGRLEAIPATQPPEEAVYPSGKPYDAYKDMREIITRASKKLAIVDPYVDSTLFSLLENVKPGVQIQILTQTMIGDFRLAGKKFKDQREGSQLGTLEVRKSGKFHDRFILADEKVFHIGASIKDVGVRTSFMSEVEVSDTKTILIETISSAWGEAEIVL